MGWVTLKSSVFVSRFEGGVVFRGGETPVVLRGKRAHDLVRVLAGLMERRLTRTALLAQFPEAVRSIVAQLLDDLATQHLLRDRDEQDPTPESALPKRFNNLWNYLADNLSRPGAALEIWRATVFYLTGSLDASLYAVRALAECAAEHIVLLASSLPRVHAEKLDAMRAEFEGLTIEIHFNAGTATSRASEAKDASAPVWIYAAGDNEFAETDCSVAHAWYFGLISGHLAVAFIDESMAEDLPRWRSLMRPALAGGKTGRLSEQRVALAAAATAFAAFNRQTGIEKAEIPTTLRIVELTSQITPIELPDRPSIVPEAPSSAAAPSPTIEGSRDVLAAEANILFDPIGGIVEDESGLDLVQVPLSVVPLRVYGYQRTGEPALVLGWGYTVDEARKRAIQRAVRAHLHTVPSISARAQSIAVEWSADLSRANALAWATMEAGKYAEVSGEPLPLESITDPDVRKLCKLLSLLTASQPALTLWRCENPTSARVRVDLNGQPAGDASASSVGAAAYEALGDACLAAQSPEIVPTPQSILASAFDAQKTEAFQSAQIDLGYPSLRAHLHCAIAYRGAL
jgi:hypothetical protein